MPFLSFSLLHIIISRMCVYATCLCMSRMRRMCKRTIKFETQRQKAAAAKIKQELLVACIKRGDILLRDPSPFVFFTLCLYFLMRFLLILLLLLIPLIAS